MTRRTDPKFGTPLVVKVLYPDVDMKARCDAYRKEVKTGGVETVSASAPKVAAVATSAPVAASPVGSGITGRGGRGGRGAGRGVVRALGGHGGSGPTPRVKRQGV